MRYEGDSREEGTISLTCGIFYSCFGEGGGGGLDSIFLTCLLTPGITSYDIIKRSYRISYP